MRSYKMKHAVIAEGKGHIHVGAVALVVVLATAVHNAAKGDTFTNATDWAQTYAVAVNDSGVPVEYNLYQGGAGTAVTSCSDSQTIVSPGALLNGVASLNLTSSWTSSGFTASGSTANSGPGTYDEALGVYVYASGQATVECQGSFCTGPSPVLATITVSLSINGPGASYWKLDGDLLNGESGPSYSIDGGGNTNGNTPDGGTFLLSPNADYTLDAYTDSGTAEGIPVTNSSFSINMDLSPVPEPSFVMLTYSALLAMAGFQLVRRRRVAFVRRGTA